MSEFNNSTVNGSACAYANLNNYNNGVQGMRPPVPASTVSGQYIVPNYGAPGYNTLMHNNAPSCSGYFNIQSAYGNDGSGCNTQYSTKLCR